MESSSSSRSGKCNCSDCMVDKYGRRPCCQKINNGPSRHYEVDFEEKKLFFEHIRQDGCCCRRSYRPSRKHERKVQSRIERPRNREIVSAGVEPACCFSYRSKHTPLYNPEFEEPCPKHGYQTEPSRPLVSVYREPSHRGHVYRSQAPVAILEERPVKSLHHHVVNGQIRPETRPSHRYRQTDQRSASEYQRVRQTATNSFGYREESYIEKERRHRATPADVVNHRYLDYEEGQAQYDVAEPEPSSPPPRQSNRRNGQPAVEIVYSTRDERTKQKQSAHRNRRIDNNYNSDSPRYPESPDPDGDRDAVYKETKYVTKLNISPRLPDIDRKSVRRSTGSTSVSVTNKKVQRSTGYQSQGHSYQSSKRGQTSPIPEFRRGQISPIPESRRTPTPSPVKLSPRKPDVNVNIRTNGRIITDEERTALFESLKREEKEYYTPPPSSQSSMTYLRSLGVVKEMVPKWDKCHQRVQEDQEALRPAFISKQKEITTTTQHRLETSVEVTVDSIENNHKTTEKPNGEEAQGIHSPIDYKGSETSLSTSKHSLLKPTVEDGSYTDEEMRVIVRQKSEVKNAELPTQFVTGSSQAFEVEEGFVTPTQSDAEAGHSDREVMLTPTSVKSITKEYKCDSAKETSEINTAKEESRYETTFQQKIEKQGKCQSEYHGHSKVGHSGKFKNRRPRPGPASIPDGLHPLSQKRSPVKVQAETVHVSVEKSEDQRSYWTKLWYPTRPEPETPPETELRPVSPPGSSFESEIGSGSSHFAMAVNRSTEVDRKTEETLKRLSADYDVIIKGSGTPKALDVQESRLEFNRSYAALRRASQIDVEQVERTGILTSVHSIGADPGSCQGCKQPFEDSDISEIISLSSRSWHSRCFKCSVCGVKLTLRNHANHETRLYCMVHFAEKIKAPRCAGCNQFILDRVYTQTKGNNVWHKNCFRCSHCNEPIVDAKFVKLKNGKIVCLPCHKKIYSRICETCGKLIKPTERYLHLKSSGHYWHATPECLKCANCGQPLDGRQRVFFKNTQTYCNMACARQDTASPKF